MANYKAKHDITRCLVCTARFNSDDVRIDIIDDSTLVGTVHDTCYDNLFSRISYANSLDLDVETDLSDASEARIAG